MKHAERLAEKPLGEDSIEGYEGSVLDFRPRPEHTSGNVLMASTFRAVGLARANERHLPLTSAEKLAKALLATNEALWSPLVGEKGALVSPPLGGERRPQPMQLTAYVPSLANWTGVLGKAGRRWKPSRIVLGTLYAGVPPAERDDWIQEIRRALDVDESDDMLAYFVENGVAAIHFDSELEPESLGREFSPPAFDPRVMTPARQLAQDLRQIFPLKPRLTRRQWGALVEGLVRLGVSFHYLWALRACDVAWQRAHEALEGKAQPNESFANALSLAARANWILSYGESALAAIRRQLRQHGRARVGLSLVLAHMKDAGLIVPDLGRGEAWLDDLERAMGEIRRQCTPDLAQAVSKQFADVVENNQRHINASAGTLRNSLYFLRYAMGQLNASDASERFQDSSFCIAHHEGGKTSRVALGSATLLALVHANCASMSPVPVTLDDFRDHLGRYGLMASIRGDHDPLSATLESLGLLVDSPDAAGGRVLIDPFEVAN